MLTMVVMVAALWAAGMLWHLTIWPALLRGSLTVAWAALVAVAMLRLPRVRALAVVCAGVLLVMVAASFQQPSLDRMWSPDQARMPVITWTGDVVHIENLRHATYRTTDDYDVRWYADRFDLASLQRVDLIVEELSAFRGIAHTFVTFGFADGRQLAVSIEVRKQRGQTYSPLRGLFRQYELMYVLGDERDLIALRTDVRGHEVRLYPMSATPEQARLLLRSMLKRAEALSERPEFYHTLYSTCATNLAGHLREMQTSARWWDWRILLPGYSDRLVFARGWIAGADDLTLEALRQRYRINGRMIPVTMHDDPASWSRRIRQIE